MMDKQMMVVAAAVVHNELQQLEYTDMGRDEVEMQNQSVQQLLHVTEMHDWHSDLQVTDSICQQVVAYKTDAFQLELTELGLIERRMDVQKQQYGLPVSKESEVVLCLEDVYKKSKDAVEQKEPQNFAEVS